MEETVANAVPGFIRVEWPAAPTLSPDERMLEFEAWADELTLSRGAADSYASASARDLLGDALEERYA